MYWAAGALVGTGALLWIDALAGGGLAGGVPALLVVAVLALLAGLAGRVASAGSAGLVTTALLAVADQVHAAGRFSLANDGVFYAVVVFAPALVGGLIGSRNRQVAELTVRQRELERRRDVLVRAARAREREQVARRVDVVLAGRLAGIVEDARALGEAGEAASTSRLEAMETTARTALGELREVLGVLRETVLGAEPAGGIEPVADLEPVAETPDPVHRSAPERCPSWIVDALLVLAVAPLAIETSVPEHGGWWWLDVLAALAQGAALVVLRRRPLPGALSLIGVALLQTAALTPLPGTVSWLLPGLLAAFLLGFRRELRIATAGLAVMIAGVGLITLAAPAGSRSPGSFGPGLVLGVLAWGAGRVAEARDRRARELRAIAGELDRTAGQEAELAAAEQRAQLARELHDVGAHALTAVCLQAGAARAWWDRDREHARPALDSLLAVAHGPIAQLSSSLGGLARDDPSEPLDAGALEVLAGLSRALGLSVAVTVSGSPLRIRDDVARVAYRIVQEALTNAARHAGRTQVRIDLAVAEHVVEVRVVDSGRETGRDQLILPVSGSGLGLQGMRERVGAIDGELIAGPLGQGFQVLARLPT